MAFNQLLWLLHTKVHNRLNGEQYIYPSCAKIYAERIEKIVEEYGKLQEFIDSSPGLCDSSTVQGKSHGLYLAAFRNGVSTVLENMNHTFLAIEVSFLSESSNSLIDILQKLEQHENIIFALNHAIKLLNEGKYHGCTILDLCEEFACHGNDVENVFLRIQHYCLRQFYQQTKLWVLQAKLYDPYNEFFIYAPEDNDQRTLSSNPNTTLNQSIYSEATNFSGSSKFNVNVNNLPNKIPLSVAIKMVFIGEALLICQNHDAKARCYDKILSICDISEESIMSQWNVIEKKEKFILKDFIELIDNLWISVNKYIHKISDEVGNVKEQLNLMWEIYLLGRGELFQEFLLKGSTILNSDVTLVDSRHLNKLFKNAIYRVYLTESSHLADQFFFKTQNKKALKEGSSASSYLYLQYKIKWPLHYLFTPEVIYRYNRLFRFLLKLKKAQMDATAWKNLSSIHMRSVSMEFIEVRMYLMSIVGNLQNYCFTNVIADEMKTLLSSVDNSNMFTDLQKALMLFLTNVECRLFLSENTLGSDTCSIASSSSSDYVYRCLIMIFHQCRMFSELDGNDMENIASSLASIKSKVLSVLKKLFSYLQKIDQTYCDSGNSSAHLYSLMLCLDYNDFYQKKFNLDTLE